MAKNRELHLPAFSKIVGGLKEKNVLKGFSLPQLDLQKRYHLMIRSFSHRHQAVTDNIQNKLKSVSIIRADTPIRTVLDRTLLMYSFSLMVVFGVVLNKLVVTPPYSK